ncbi:MAG: hypothetical protein KAV42_10820 [Candidatus Krumholzibacteria bacterium]|nr:hypothetical protein [Candidatus Krumholzibacteria bacterium]
MKNLVIVFAIALLISAIFVADSHSDPCLVTYPSGACVYRYDTAEYFTVTVGDSLYDPMYDRGGEVLIEIGTLDIDHSIYQAPFLSSFEPSVDGMEGYFFYNNEFTLIVDGFSNEPVVYDNVMLVFENLSPNDCTGTVIINGVPLTGDTYNAGSLTVSTPTAEGNNYSDVIELEVKWLGCYGMNVWAYADINGNGIFDGGECFSAFSHDVTIGTSNASWGNIKNLYK